jgi:hypothetical protein
MTQHPLWCEPVQRVRNSTFVSVLTHYSNNTRKRLHRCFTSMHQLKRLAIVSANTNFKPGSIASVIVQHSTHFKAHHFACEQTMFAHYIGT